MAFGARPAGDASLAWIQASPDPQRYGHDLYANLRALDASGCDEILVEAPPDSAEWSAVRDRLMRARSR
jgi:L-threonylcarbamoyladenylate synthase